MADQLYYDAENGAYCRCCGSRDLMTLDAAIDSIDFGVRRDLLLKKRLWLAVEALEEGELDDIARSLAFYADLEEPDDFLCGFWDFIHAQTDIYLDQVDRHKPSEPMELHNIEAVDPTELLDGQKKAITRLWRGFDEETKQSFLDFAKRSLVLGSSK